ncbi:MAG: Flp pilus assembly complex ATPase component TadA [Candidatus Margulisbacteria bacterium]|nr:Flp pilus assembly complex ATPase component TadA [Candidatus Margulisiibacteriota bacterium]MBU1617759.1 Flp pilus assembly complex ATPase component TadA [Candidatus Margulisiibacteriota bacterium]
MVDKSKSLRESLVKSGLLTEAQIQEAVEDARRNGETLIMTILKSSLVAEELIASFLEKEMEFPKVDLASYLVDQKAVDLLPITLAKKYHVIPLFKVGDVLTVAMIDPFDVVALDEVRSKTKCDVEPMVSTPREIDAAIAQYYGVAGSVDDLIKGIYPGAEQSSILPKAIKDEEGPISKLVNLLIFRGIAEKASDIHIDPTERNVRVRYRIDGLLHDVSSAPAYLQSLIITRIKVMGKMDIAESRVPQDGRFELKMETKAVDVRVSSYPTIYGEAIVMRLLDKSKVLYALEDLGFSARMLEQYKVLVDRPYGIVLVTGPTGSGKTTTLYSTLNNIITAEKNIMTIEDPVEYELPGTRQSQVNVKAGMDFSRALPSILRQDPDVILVGEIRDLDTAKIAIQAALTGHLVFSTLHTNDAAGALNRLTDMGIEPFLVSSAVAGVIAQRLVRLICVHCKTPFVPAPEVIQKLGLKADSDLSFYHGKGCKSCHTTGYEGRFGIYEILTMNDKIKDLVIAKAATHEMKKAAIEGGMRTLRDDGMEKAIAGKTTVDEVLRVTQLD